MKGSHQDTFFNIFFNWYLHKSNTTTHFWVSSQKKPFGPTQFFWPGGKTFRWHPVNNAVHYDLFVTQLQISSAKYLSVRVCSGASEWACVLTKSWLFSLCSYVTNSSSVSDEQIVGKSPLASASSTCNQVSGPFLLPASGIQVISLLFTLYFLHF